MVRGGRRRSNSMDSVDSYDSRGSGRRGGRRTRSPRRPPPPPARGGRGVTEPRGQRSKYAPSLVTPTNRGAGGPYYPAQPAAVVAQAAPFGAHQLVTYHQQQQQQQFQPAPVAAHHHQLFTQQQMLSLHQQQVAPQPPVTSQHLAPLPVVQHVAAALPPPQQMHHMTPPPPQVVQMPAVVEPVVDAAELYRTLCSSNDEVLPAGWEKIAYNGQIIYLDHLNREAHDEHPYKIWSRAFGAQQPQQ